MNLHSNPSLWTPQRSPKSIDIGIGQLASIRYRTSILDPVRGLIPCRDWKRNLIVDVGLDFVATTAWADCLQYGVIGTGTTPTLSDSGATTASRAGTTVTASAGFFTAGMAGMLIRWDSGEQAYISSFTDTTHVETVTSGTIGSGEFTVYAVNQTGLATETKRSNTTSGLGPNSISWDSGTSSWVVLRTYIFSAEVGSVTYREVGWAPANTGNLFGRDVLAGAGDSLVSGQQYVITVQLSVLASPIALTAVGNVGTGLNTAGNAVIETVLPSRASEGGAFSWVGWGQANAVLEPMSSGASCIIAGALSDWTQTEASNSTTLNGIGPFTEQQNSSLNSYTAGAFSRTKTATFTTGQLVGNITGVAIVSPADGGAVRAKGFSIKFTTAQAKTGTQTLTVVFRFNWQRSFA